MDLPDSIKKRDAAFKARMTPTPPEPTGKEKRQALEGRDTVNKIRQLEAQSRAIQDAITTLKASIPTADKATPLTRDEVNLMIRKVTPRPDQKTVFGRPTSEGIVLQASPSDAVPYDGQFAVSVDRDVTNAVLVNPGFAIVGVDTIPYLGKETPGITTTANGYIIAEVALNAITVTFSTSYPTQTVNTTKVVLAEIVFNGGVLSEIIQEQYGEIICTAPNLSKYTGQFAVSRTPGENTKLTVLAGKLIAGVSTVDYIGTNTLDAAAGTGFVILTLQYIGVPAAWTITVSYSTSYPAQAYAIFRVVLASVTVFGGVVTGIQQQHFGEVHVAGRVV